MPRKKTTKETYELNDIETQEVSLVDRAANLRTFLVVKNADGSEGEEEIETIPSTEEAKALLLGEPVVEAKADEPVVEAVVEVKPDEPAVEVVVEAVVETPAVEAVVEATPEVVAEVTDEVAKEDAQAVFLVEPPNGDKMKIHPGSKKALAGALAAVSARVEALQAALNDAEEDVTSTYMPWMIVDGLEYLCALAGHTADLSMDMYGAEWEIEAAAVAEMAKSFKDEKATTIEKIGRAISGARMRKMKELHSSLSTVAAQFNEIIAEVEADKPVVEEVGKAVSVTIEEVTTLTNQVTELSKSQASDKQQIAQLQEELRKSKELLDMPTKPNARRGDDSVNKAADSVVWPSDLASKR